MLMQFEDVLFPVLEMRTNTKHDPQGDRAGTQLQINHQIQKLGGGDSRYGLGLSVGSDSQTSSNPPYFFTVEIYAIITMKDSGVEGEAEAKLVLQNSMPILMGGIRERISEMTARGPWGKFLVNPTALAEPTMISFI